VLALALQLAPRVREAQRMHVEAGDLVRAPCCHVRHHLEDLRGLDAVRVSGGVKEAARRPGSSRGALCPVVTASTGWDRSGEKSSATNAGTSSADRVRTVLPRRRGIGWSCRISARRADPPTREAQGSRRRCASASSARRPHMGLLDFVRQIGGAGDQLRVDEPARRTVSENAHRGHAAGHARPQGGARVSQAALAAAAGVDRRQIRRYEAASSSRRSRWRSRSPARSRSRWESSQASPPPAST